MKQHKILKDVTLSPYKELFNNNIKYNDIMDHAIGGRAQCIKPGIHKDLCGIDVNSMYPCGEIYETYKYIPNKLGIYEVKIKKQSYPHPIPYRKSKHKAYDWNYDKPFTK